VVDLRLRFGLETRKEDNKENRIVVIETISAIVGFIVDEVTEVLRIKSSSIESTPEMITTGVEIRYIEGVAMLEDSLLIVLNTDLIFSKEEHESMASMGD
jgi:purine-binding chemotaxis protein CheW